MNLQKLSNEELDQNLKSLVSKEREILSDILEHILEIDRRKFYLKMAYSSLFDYLTKHLGYSAGSAQRRIDAARMLKDVPELSQKLESGSLNLSQVSLVQKAIRQKKVQISNKREILESLEHKSFFESQSIVSKALDLDLKEETKITSQKDESVRFEITLTKEQWEKLQHMKSLLPNGSGSWDEVLEYVADKVIEQKTKSRTAPKPSENRITISMRKHIRKRDQCCQFKDKATGRICGTKLNLQIDHIKPLWAGGQSTADNLQVLCANHNRYRYQQQAGCAP